MSPLAEKIVQQNVSKQAALAGLAELKMVAQEHFFSNREWTGEEAQLLSGIDKDNLEAVFAEAEKELAGTESLIIYVALDLPEVAVAQIGAKARELFGSETMLEFRIEPALLGGAALAWKGQYQDYSLRAKFEEKKEGIAKIYTNYLTRQLT